MKTIISLYQQPILLKMQICSRLTYQIKKNMGEIDSELVNLRQNLSKINGSYAEIDNTLKFKWKEIKKLDTLETDLNKLRYLSELPNMFKQAIAKYESK